MLYKQLLIALVDDIHPHQTWYGMIKMMKVVMTRLLTDQNAHSGQNLPQNACIQILNRVYANHLLLFVGAKYKIAKRAEADNSAPHGPWCPASKL